MSSHGKGACGQPTKHSGNEQGIKTAINPPRNIKQSSPVLQQHATVPKTQLRNGSQPYPLHSVSLTMSTLLVHVQQLAGQGGLGIQAGPLRDSQRVQLDPQCQQPSRELSHVGAVQAVCKAAVHNGLT